MSTRLGFQSAIADLANKGPAYGWSAIGGNRPLRAIAERLPVVARDGTEGYDGPSGRLPDVEAGEAAVLLGRLAVGVKPAALAEAADRVGG